jgi:hypothetical protein
MALSLLLDEQMSPEVAVQMQKKRPDVSVMSVQVWRNGLLRGQPDERILRAATEEGLTLVTYDLSTILPILTEWGEAGEDHAGVIFIDNLSISQRDLGGQIAALIQQWDAAHEWDWMNMVFFLRPASATV